MRICILILLRILDGLLAGPSIEGNAKNSPLVSKERKSHHAQNYWCPISYLFRSFNDLKHFFFSIL